MTSAARLHVDCSHCGHTTVVELGGIARPATRAHLATPTPAPVPTRRKIGRGGICKCGHERQQHRDGTGECRQCAGSNGLGLPPCTQYHTKKLPDSVAYKPQGKPNGAANSDETLAAFNALAGELAKGERRVLTVVAQHGSASRVLISTVTGYSKNTRNLYLQELARRGYVLPAGSDFAISDTGRAALGPYEKLPTGDKLRLYWLEKLPEGLSRVLACITDARSPITRAAVSQITGYSKNTRNLYIQDLVRRRLVEKAGSGVRASAALFDR